MRPRPLRLDEGGDMENNNPIFPESDPIEKWGTLVSKVMKPHMKDTIATGSV